MVKTVCKCSIPIDPDLSLIESSTHFTGDDIYVAHVDIKSKIQRLRQQEAGHLPAPKTLSLYR